MKRRLSELIVVVIAALGFAATAHGGPPPVTPLKGEIPVLVILQCFKDNPGTPSFKDNRCGTTFTAVETASGPDPRYAPSYAPRTLRDPKLYDEVLFGSGPSTRDFLRENSYGKFTIKKAAILGWYVAPQPESYYWTTDPGVPQDVRDLRHRQKWTDAIRQADVDFDFSLYDVDKDGMVETHELAIVIVVAHNKEWGAFVRVAAEAPLTSTDSCGIGKCKIDGAVVEVYAFGSWFARFAHEFLHIMPTWNLRDLYTYGIDKKQVDAFSLMGFDWLHPHLDPWNKMKLGWLNPTSVTKDGERTIKDSETHAEAYILRDPCHDPREYFLVENRWPGGSYDADLPGAKGLPSKGLAIWHIDETKSDMPEVITLERAQNSSDSVALWRAGGGLFDPVPGPKPPVPPPSTWYSFNDTSAPRNSRWNDGTASGIEIKGFSVAGRRMTATFSTRQDDYEAVRAPYDETREKLRAKLDGLESRLAALEEELANVPVDDLALRRVLVGQIARTKDQIKAVTAKLASLEKELKSKLDAFCGKGP